MQNIPLQASRIVNKFEGAYAQRYTVLCAALGGYDHKQPTDRTTINALISEDLEWLHQQTGNELDVLRYRAFLLILRDLLTVSWQIHYSNDGIDIIAPYTDRHKGLSQEEQTQLKEGVRYELSAACREQLTEKATQNFIRSVEEPSATSKIKKSIKVLLADGQELADRFRDVNKLHPDEQITALQHVIRPYLVLVEGEKRDPFTGIKYGDIWRYFRLTWSIPYLSSPGRKLFYLVRDAAHPYHAIMAIASLSNSALQVRDRDNYIGWTAERIIRQLKQAIQENNFPLLKATMDLMEGHIERGLQDIDLTGLVNAEEIIHPDEALLRRLQADAEGFSRERHRQLQITASTTPYLNNNDLISISDTMHGVFPIEDTSANQSNGAEIPRPDNHMQTKLELSDDILDWDDNAKGKANESRRQLVFKKRTQILYQLLYARKEFQRIRESAQSLGKAIEKALSRNEFRAALTYATFSNKREKVGINMLEITTCGAIPPYNHLLGGKLMALLLLSPQIGADYKTRYSNKYSVITSQIKGEKVYRDCDLVFLSTTSLYSIGSSQYNRLSLPAGIFHPQQPRIEYKSHPTQMDIRNGFPERADKKDWKTSGFGTVHFSNETTEAVVALGIRGSGFREVNSIFGEGPSPKLRKIRGGLIAVGLDPEILLRHNQPRLLYCIELCTNSLRYLNGEDVALPDYITDPNNVTNATEKIADYWRRRWLMSRLHVPDILDRIAKFTSENFTLQLDEQPAVRKEVGAFMSSDHSPLDNENTEDTFLEGTKPSSLSATSSVSTQLTIDFIQKLYLNQSSYSDFHDSDILNILHIPTSLDNFIQEKIADGYSVVLTGNAGDGKTHLLKQLSGSLTHARVVEDASELEPADIVAKWQEAIKAGVPFCIAANEWPLFQLISNYAHQLPVLSVVNNQLKNSLVYESPGHISNTGMSSHTTKNTNANEKVVTINLGLRNPLSSEFVESAMITLLRAETFASCANCAGSNTCDAARNRNLLMEQPRIRTALTTLIDLVAIFSQHVTVRELFGFLSYAVFGGRDSSALSREHGKNEGFYSQQIFSKAAKGTLFTLLRQHLDPAKISHPKWDNRLYFGHPEATATTKWELGEVPIQTSLVKDPRHFEFLKRRFFFEHVNGRDMLYMLTDDEIEFSKLLDPTNRDLDEARDQIVDAINAYFCPELTKTQQNPAKDLIVWSAYSYDEKVVRAFTSWFVIDRRRYIQLQRPRLVSDLAKAFPYRPDHLRLVVFPDSDPVALTLDFDLFHTLMEVQRGLPSVLVDESKSVKLLRFMSHLEARRSDGELRPLIRSYTVQGRDLLQFEVDTIHKKIVMLR